METKFNFLKIRVWKTVFIVTSVAIIESCTVTNNLYINDPVPLEKDKGYYYFGLGMGLEPRIDSISVQGAVYSNHLDRSFNLCFGGMYGISEHFSLGGNIHLPKIVGGFGASIRPQVSLFHKNTIFNIALSGDVGFVVPKDSIKIFGTTTELENKTRGAFNTSIAVPMSIKLGNDVRLIFTPRYSYNILFLRKSFDSYRNRKLHATFPCVSVGLRFKKVYFESSLIYWDSRPIYMFGAAIVFSSSTSTLENITQYK